MSSGNAKAPKIDDRKVDSINSNTTHFTIVDLLAAFALPEDIK
jgi:hypothetical protein